GPARAWRQGVPDPPVADGARKVLLLRGLQGRGGVRPASADRALQGADRRSGAGQARQARAHPASLRVTARGLPRAQGVDRRRLPGPGMGGAAKASGQEANMDKGPSARRAALKLMVAAGAMGLPAAHALRQSAQAAGVPAYDPSARFDLAVSEVELRRNT